MNKLRYRTTLVLIVVLMSATLGVFLSPAHGQLTGLVCLAPVGATACPAPPVTIGGFAGSQLSVNVIVQGSDAISGFDITLRTNHTVLKPADAVADSTTLFSGGSAIVKCIGGVLKAGSTCAQTDTVDTIHFAYLGPIGFVTQSPTSGLLFAAVFNVTGTNNVVITFQTGCSPSSVNGTSTCVSVSNGTIGIPSESVQSAMYSQAAAPTFTVQIDQTSIAVSKGLSADSTITIMSLNNYAGTISFSTRFTPTVNHPPTTSFTPLSVNMVSGGIGITVLTIQTKSNTSKASYLVTLTASDGHLSEVIQLQVLIFP